MNVKKPAASRLLKYLYIGINVFQPGHCFKYSIMYDFGLTVLTAFYHKRFFVAFQAPKNDIMNLINDKWEVLVNLILLNILTYKPLYNSVSGAGTVAAPLIIQGGACYEHRDTD